MDDPVPHESGAALKLRFGRAQFRALLPVAFFDLLCPLALYYVLHAAGVAAVPSLILSGLPPALRVLLAMVVHRRLDVIGAFVLGGIVVGSIAGGVTDDPHLVLLDGVVPTVAFGAICLASLGAARPLIFRFALEVFGSDTAAGLELVRRWGHSPIRRAFRFMTAAWGLAYLAEAAVQISIIETMSATFAKTTSNVLPVVVTVVMAAWNLLYARQYLHGDLGPALRLGGGRLGATSRTSIEAERSQ